MNVVFDKRSLRVVSLLESDISSKPEQEVLRSMFPRDFAHYVLWNIKENIANCPIGLSVKLDNNSNPESLLYKGKIIYASTAEDKEKIRLKAEKDRDKILTQILPRNLRTSIGSDIIKLWQKSPYTKPEIIQDLLNFSYFSDSKTYPVSWWGVFVDAGGYSNMSRSILFRLHNYHIIAKAEMLPSPPQISQTGQYYVSKYASFNLKRIKSYPRICGFSPHPHPPHSGRQVFFTMMETETLHPTFRDLCNKYSNEIWVPSAHNKKMFIDSGVKKEIHVMPLGIDEVIYKNALTVQPKDLSKMPISNILGRSVSDGINKFRFFSLFGWSYRKGVDILIKSFVRAFTAKDDVALIMYSHHVGPDKVVQDVIRYASEVRGSNYPQILFIHSVTPESEMPSLYRIGHAFVNCSRGEGFSLPQIEASASGLPVISCNNTGMSEYLTEDNSFMITTEEKEMCSPEMHWITPYYHGQLFPRLGEDQINQAVRHMQFVVNNYDKALEKGKKLNKEVWEKYTWDKATNRISERIKEIS